MAEGGGLPSMGSHRVRRYRSDLAASYIKTFLFTKILQATNYFSESAKKITKPEFFTSWHMRSYNINFFSIMIKAKSN